MNTLKIIENSTNGILTKHKIIGESVLPPKPFSEKLNTYFLEWVVNFHVKIAGKPLIGY